MTYPVSLSLFFPAYNEEGNLRDVVGEAVRTVEASPYVGEYEIIIINDGSRDQTLAIGHELATRYAHVRVVDHGKNRGYGAALKSGFASATMDYVFFTDADRQFDIVELQNLLVHLPTHDVVIGYRAPRRDPFMRLLNARVWNLLNRLLFGLRVRDIDCAFKVFRRDLVQRLRLESRGAMISAETLIRLKRNNVTIKEVPVSHLPRTAGSPTGAKPSVILRAFREMVQLYRGELGLVTNKEAVKFMSVGLLNTALDALAYIVLTRDVPAFTHHVVAAKFLSFLVGTVSSLAINRSWTFGMRGRLSLGEVVRFYASVSVGILINVEAMNVLVGFGMYDLAALLCATLLTFVFNFTVSKFWVFRTRESRLAHQA